jgi:hypothetical protein
MGREENPRRKVIESARRDKAKGNQTRRSRGEGKDAISMYRTLIRCAENTYCSIICL